MTDRETSSREFDKGYIVVVEPEVGYRWWSSIVLASKADDGGHHGHHHHTVIHT